MTVLEAQMVISYQYYSKNIKRIAGQISRQLVHTQTTACNPIEHKGIDQQGCRYFDRS